MNLFLLTLCPRVRAAHLGQEGLLRDKITMLQSLRVTDTSTSLNFYTGLKFMSKTHFYGRVAAEGILAITYENRPFYGRGAAEANFSV